MPIYYMDYVNGLDANSGSDWTNAKKTIDGFTSAVLAPGDTIRIAKSPDPTFVGNATWTKLSKTITLASSVTANISTCEDSWVAGANVTLTYDTGIYKEGSRSQKLVTNASVTSAAKLSYYTMPGSVGSSSSSSWSESTVDISGDDFSSYQQISLWIRNETTALTAGLLQVRLCSDTLGETAVNTLNIPAVASTAYWIPITIDFGSALGSSIRSVAIWCTGNYASKTTYIDNIIACKSPSSADSLSLTSLIGKDVNIQRTNGTKYVASFANNTAIGTEPWTNTAESSTSSSNSSASSPSSLSSSSLSSFSSSQSSLSSPSSSSSLDSSSSTSSSSISSSSPSSLSSSSPSSSSSSSLDSSSTSSGLGGKAILNDYDVDPWLTARTTNAVNMNACSKSASLWFYPLSTGAWEDWLIAIGPMNLDISLNNGYVKVSGGVSYTDTELISLDTWNHVAFTYNDITNTFKLFVNGTKKTTVSVDLDNLGSSNILFGSNIVDYVFDGRLDEINVWQRELSESEVDVLYNGGIGRKGDISVSPWNSNLVVGYHFQDSLADFAGAGAGNFQIIGTDATYAPSDVCNDETLGSSSSSSSDVHSSSSSKSTPSSLSSLSTNPSSSSSSSIDSSSSSKSTNSSSSSSSSTRSSQSTNSSSSSSVDSKSSSSSSEHLHASSYMSPLSISNYLQASNFGFAIETDAVIYGIKVEISKSASDASVIKDYSVKIVRSNGSFGVQNKADSNYWGTSPAYTTYGGNTDLWGETWTATNVNDSDFGVVVSATNEDGSSRIANVDHVRITVVYRAYDGWYAIQSINGATVYIDGYNNSTPQVIKGYYGNTEACQTYKRQCIQTPILTGASQRTFTTQEAGTSGYPITYEGGYNTSSNLVDGITYFDGQVPTSDGIYHGYSYVNLKNIGFVRYLNGLRTYGNGIGAVGFENCHVTASSNIGLYQEYTTGGHTAYSITNCTFNNNYSHNAYFGSLWSCTWYGTARFNSSYASGAYGIYFAQGYFNNVAACVIYSCNNNTDGINIQQANTNSIQFGELQLNYNGRYGLFTYNSFYGNTFNGSVYATYNSSSGIYLQNINTNGNYSNYFYGKLYLNNNPSYGLYINSCSSNFFYEEINASNCGYGLYFSGHVNLRFDKNIYVNNCPQIGLYIGQSGSNAAYITTFNGNIVATTCGTGVHFPHNTYFIQFNGTIDVSYCSVGVTFSGIVRHIVFNSSITADNCTTYGIRFIAEASSSNYPMGIFFNGDVYIRSPLGNPYYGSYGIYANYGDNIRYNGQVVITKRNGAGIWIDGNVFDDTWYFSYLEVTDCNGWGIQNNATWNGAVIYIRAGKFRGNISGGIATGQMNVYASNVDFTGQINEASVAYLWTENAIYSNKHDRISNGHKIFMNSALVQSDTGTVHTSPGISWRMMPLSTWRDVYWPVKLPVGKVAFKGGRLATISLWFYKDSANINGQLFIASYQDASLTTNLAAMMSNATYTWQKLSVSFTPSEECVIEIEARAWGGTTFNVWVDDLEIEQ